MKRAVFAMAVCAAIAAAGAAKPQAVVIFYADDLGYFDTSTYGSQHIPTPNLDALAAEGVKFLDAHSATSVCTPSRYSLLTGNYAFRRKNNHILDGDAKLILPLEGGGVLTLPAMMREAGYRTAAIGKWHLGLGAGSEPTDWNSRVSPGPREVGFESSYIMAATADRVPCVFLRDGNVVGLDPADPIEISYSRSPDPIWEGEITAKTNPELLKWWGRSADKQHDKTIIDGISRIGHQRGGKAANWKGEDIADVLAEEAENFIASSEGKPIFLYFCTADIHVPRDPHPRYKGKSQLGLRGDVAVQMDDTLGKVRDSLARHGYLDTLFIFTSDNGPVVGDGYLDGARMAYAAANVNPAHPFTGGKYTIYEGGTRVPMVVAWPGHTPKGATSSALVSQTDFARSIASIIGYEVPEGSMGDSQDLSQTLLGARATGRDTLVEEAGWGSWRGFRMGSWKLMTDGENAKLFDLAQDVTETEDVASSRSDLADFMKASLRDTVQEHKRH
ncbi:MAG: sulfatase-like hydrolase/transferase [Kiritimatiellae bacterium]|nr:sulfatase-like hydrolase/transferase [Kiritimatiellia bacterium]